MKAFTAKPRQYYIQEPFFFNGGNYPAKIYRADDGKKHHHLTSRTVRIDLKDDTEMRKEREQELTRKRHLERFLDFKKEVKKKLDAEVVRNAFPNTFGGPSNQPRCTTTFAMHPSGLLYKRNILKNPL